MSASVNLVTNYRLYHVKRQILLLLELSFANSSKLNLILVFTLPASIDLSFSFMKICLKGKGETERALRGPPSQQRQNTKKIVK